MTDSARTAEPKHNGRCYRPICQLNGCMIPQDCPNDKRDDDIPAARAAESRPCKNCGEPREHANHDLAHGCIYEPRTAETETFPDAEIDQFIQWAQSPKGLSAKPDASLTLTLRKAQRAYERLRAEAADARAEIAGLRGALAVEVETNLKLGSMITARAARSSVSPEIP